MPNSSELEHLIHPDALGEAFGELSPNELSRLLLSFLPFWVGPYEFAVEATRVVYVGGRELKTEQLKGILDEVHRVSLRELLGLKPRADSELIITRSDDGRHVAFRVDHSDRLESISLPDIRPLPPVLAETIQIPFLWGIAVRSVKSGSLTAKSRPLLLLEPSSLLGLADV